MRSCSLFPLHLMTFRVLTFSHFLSFLQLIERYETIPILFMIGATQYLLRDIDVVDVRMRFFFQEHYFKLD